MNWKKPSPPKEPNVTAAPKRRESISTHAAAVGQQILDLETELDETMARANAAEHRADVAESRCEWLEKEVERLTYDKSYYQQRDIETQTKLRTAGNIILEAMQKPADTSDHYRGNRKDVNLVRAVEQAVTGNGGQHEEKPLPAFLTAGPRIMPEEGNE